MIIKAKHNFVLDPFFRYYVLWKMKRHFQSFTINGVVQDKSLPILLICNHVSWWDGIWTLYVNQQLFKRKYHFMMLEEELRKNWFFQYTGGFSIKKQSKSVFETFNYTAELLSDERNMVLLFPQGNIKSIYQNKFVFEKGIEKILQRTKNDIQIIFQANLIDYFADAKPNAFFNLHNYSGAWNSTEIENAYNTFYKQCLEAQAKKEI
ncbi:1-acyl-sn-glycerol-3-phosphate acyltransferase [uncultured Draconibacterium sp.]|uniref:1-acyl-sn-glycerol-3-phosphate acyltransferase n=1 Tax=uncultured Draconibacterium sp. TaxID=1573823 RepID=UPI0025E51BB2|nr:1-acyl-sn-glycerol-3-phosphate acyltransferase [uncultured Draconibacterium sp.]